MVMTHETLLCSVVEGCSIKWPILVLENMDIVCDLEYFLLEKELIVLFTPKESCGNIFRKDIM